MLAVDPPKVNKKLLPWVPEETLSFLIDQATNIRDKAILALFADSGLRLSELASIRLHDIDWSKHLVKVRCKGGKEGLAVFGSRTEELLRQWLAKYNPNGGSIFGLKPRGIQAMLWRLQSRTGLKCSAHCLRRSFATILSKRGIDALHIMRLGRWESLAMVDRYTKNVRFEDSLKYYVPVVGSP
jgi:integrase/recombinase XerC